MTIFNFLQRLTIATTSSILDAGKVAGSVSFLPLFLLSKKRFFMVLHFPTKNCSVRAFDFRINQNDQME